MGLPKLWAAKVSRGGVCKRSRRRWRARQIPNGGHTCSSPRPAHGRALARRRLQGSADHDADFVESGNASGDFEAVEWIDSPKAMARHAGLISAP